MTPPRLLIVLLALMLPAIASGCLGTNSLDPVSAPAAAGASASQPPAAGAVRAGTSAGPVAATTSPTIVQARQERRNGDLAAALRDYRQLAATGSQPSSVLLELGEVELATGDAASALTSLQRLLASNPPDPLAARTRLLLSTARLAVGEWDAALKGVDVASAPDGLGDLVAIRRAEAALRGGNPPLAKTELARQELRGSTNRPILERAARLAEQAGDAALAGELYGRGARFFGWSSEKSRMLKASADAYRQAGMTAKAIDQYQLVLENYTSTKLGEQAAEALKDLGGLTPFHRALLATVDGDADAARAFFEEAAQGGDYVTAASSRLRQMDVTDAWIEAGEEYTVESYRRFRTLYPDSYLATEARFQEGYIPYRAEKYSQAAAAWDDAAARASGDDRARALLWAGKAMEKLGRSEDTQARLKAASEVRPSSYYTVRAGDLLAGRSGWTRASGLPKPVSAEERTKAEQWIQEWAKQTASDPQDEVRERRGLGLVALGMTEEAEAELNGVIADSEDPRFLFRLALSLVEQALWSPASRAAARVVSLSPAKTTADAPSALQRLVYPSAYPDLVAAQVQQRGLDPVLLMSLIHQESRWDPFALSMSDARGLAQVMPATGKGIAQVLKRDFSPDDLFRPATAVEFGAYYLAEQLKYFDGDPFRALAAYNAGATPVPKWAAADPDLFVERITYSQTREYVRQIYLHYSIYRSLAEE